MSKKIYVCGPLTSNDIEHDNLRRAMDAHASLLKLGFFPFTPHLQTFVAMSWAIPEDLALQWCEAWLPSCDAVLVLPGWEHSRGSCAEVAMAKALGLPIYNSISSMLVEASSAR